MPVLGLVLILEDAGEATRARVEGVLTLLPALELGAPSAHRWPVVLESDTQRDAESLIDELAAVPGIAGVDIVYADFEDLLGASAPGMSP